MCQRFQEQRARGLLDNMQVSMWNHGDDMPDDLVETVTKMLTKAQGDLRTASTSNPPASPRPAQKPAPKPAAPSAVHASPAKALPPVGQLSAKRSPENPKQTIPRPKMQPPPPPQEPSFGRSDEKGRRKWRAVRARSEPAPCAPAIVSGYATTNTTTNAVPANWCASDDGLAFAK